MDTYVYDGSFEGWLCVLVAAVRADTMPAVITMEAEQGGLFGDIVEVGTDRDLATRARQALEARMTAAAVGKLYRAFLSEQPDVERTLLELVQAVLSRGAGTLSDVRFAPAFRVMQLAQQVGREVHRMHAFVRFEEQADGCWVATVEPDFNVLPLLGEHFTARYPAMDWAIADVRRRYALVHEVAAGPTATRFAPVDPDSSAAPADREVAFQQMWRVYFRAANIPERANPRLHLQHVPRRYWPYLTEKQAP